MKWLLCSMFLLVGCAADNIPPPKTVQFQPPPEPVKPNLGHVNFKIINNQGKIYYALTKDNVTILFDNLSSINQYISEQQNIINFYKENSNKIDVSH